VTDSVRKQTVFSMLFSNASSTCMMLGKRLSSPSFTRSPLKIAAALMGVEVKTLANWRWRGCGPPFVKLPRRAGKGAVRYNRQTVLRWLADQTRRSTSDSGIADVG
jgi:hypothetical protein